MIEEDIKKKIRHITLSAQLSAILEASTEKPGNVSPLHDFADMRYEHFLAGGIAIGRSIENAALNGFDAGIGKIDPGEIQIGKHILNAVSDVKKSHTGGNTHLGIIMLFVPIAAGYGMRVADITSNLRSNIQRILKLTTVADSICLYDAIALANPGGMGKVKNFDVMNCEAREELAKRDMTFYDIMKLSAKRDRIAEELTTGMKIIFETGYPTLKQTHKGTRDIRSAIIQTYLVLLSRFPDTLIARKSGFEIADKVTKYAERVLKAGGILTAEGKEEIRVFDTYLYSHKLNPGTTADLIAGSLMIALLDGLRL